MKMKRRPSGKPSGIEGVFTQKQEYSDRTHIWSSGMSRPYTDEDETVAQWEAQWNRRGLHTEARVHRQDPYIVEWDVEALLS